MLILTAAGALAKVNLEPHISFDPESPPALLGRLDVANLLGVPLSNLTWLAYKLPPHRKYTRFLIHRHGGGRSREIKAPVRPLKDVQRRLASQLLEWYEPPAGVHGFVRGRSAVSNARVHQKQEWVLRVDIEDFFPSINFGRVFGLFMAYPFQYPKKVASLLAQICCVDNQLPQGAPTSPIISNFICRRLDSELARLARSERCYYSRYADDLCFSTRRGEFPEALAFVDETGTLRPGRAVERLVADNGFSLQEAKTRLVWRAQRQRVTGLVVNRGANVDRRYVRDLRNLLYIWRRYGAEAAEASFARANPRLNWPPGKRLPSFAQVVQGRIQHVGHVKGWSDSVYRDLALAMQGVDADFAPTTLHELHAPIKVKVYTEGETDAMHLQAAKAYFDGLGEFQNLDLKFPEESGAEGSSRLLSHCHALAVTEQLVTCVCLFDRDEAKILGKAVGSDYMKNHSNNVIAVSIKAPEWRDEAAPLCIELLYQDQDLRRKDSNGRRLYLSSEFNRETGHHESEAVHILNPKHEGLVREHVLRFPGGASVGLSKRDFARYVSEEAPGFTGVDFGGFRETFRLLEEAVGRFSSLT